MITKTMENMIFKYLNLFNRFKVAIFSLILFSFTGNILAQEDIFSKGNSIKYAQYLLSSRQYNLAADEYERLIFLDTSNVDFKYKLIKSYYYSGKKDRAIYKLQTYYPNTKLFEMPEKLSNAYTTLLQVSDSLNQSLLFLNKSKTIDDKNKFIFQWSYTMLNGNYKQAKKMLSLNNQLDKAELNQLNKITLLGINQKHKSPFVAGALSTAVPGLGKVYTKNYFDAFIAFIFVAGNGWQAYRGFKKNGTHSFSGWFFGTLSVGFYAGNIFGSVKAAKRFNKLRTNETKQNTYNYLQHHFF